MPRMVETHLLAQRFADGARVRVHRCGRLLVAAQAPVDGPWRRGLFVLPDPAAAAADRDRRLRELRRTGYHLVTVQRFTVPAALATAAATDLGALDAPFAAAWAASWAPALAALTAARHRDGPRRDHLVLLPRFARHTRTHPWGAPLVAALADAPHAAHERHDLLAAGVGPATLDWLRTYYAPTLEQTPASLPGQAQDSALTYTFALRLWQPDLSGPLAALEQALATARDLAAAGVVP